MIAVDSRALVDIVIYWPGMHNCPVNGNSRYPVAMIESTQTSPELTKLERAVLEASLTGVDRATLISGPWFEGANVEFRTPSGVGFVTKLRNDNSSCLPNLPAGESLSVVYAEHPELPSGAEFVLQVKDGRVCSIEAFCYEGMWPDDESLFRIRTPT